MRSTLTCLAATAMGLVVGGGCGGGEAGPVLATVTGTVTLDGQPADHGYVYFHPDSSRGTTGPTSMAEIGADGRYAIRSSQDREGAVVGFHLIRVEIRHPPKDQNDTLPALMTLEKYTNPKTSGLTAEVKSGIENTIDLAVTSK